MAWTRSKHDAQRSRRKACSKGKIDAACQNIDAPAPIEIAFDSSLSFSARCSQIDTEAIMFANFAAP